MYAAAETGLLSCSCRSNPRPAESLTRIQLPRLTAMQVLELAVHHACNIRRWVVALSPSDQTKLAPWLALPCMAIPPVSSVNHHVKIYGNTFRPPLQFSSHRTSKHEMLQSYGTPTRLTGQFHKNIIPKLQHSHAMLLYTAKTLAVCI
jgi:hypothetical protein